MAENNWVSVVITPISGVIILLMTGRGPPCRSIGADRLPNYIRDSDMPI